MQIVIDIPEEIYKESKIIDGLYENVIQIPLEAIANGTVLPEKHGRLIDADVFSHEVVKYSHQSTKTIGKALSDTPTILEANE